MSVQPDFLNKIIERGVEHFAGVMIDVSSRLQGDDGQTYGMVEATGADFLSFYNFLRQYPIEVPQPPLQIGKDVVEQPPRQAVVNLLEDYLRVIAPEYAAKLDRQFEQEQAKIERRVS